MKNIANTEDIILKPRRELSHAPDKKTIYDCIIVGAGIAGFSAGMYASRLGLKTLCIGENDGGTVALTESIENYPGIISISGQKLAELMRNHMLDYNVHYIIDVVDSAKKEKRGLFKVSCSKTNYFSKTLILATGTTEKKLGVEGENKFIGKGVSYCALCDLTFTANRTIAVVGGGDSAIKETNLLAKYAKKIYIINNEEKLHGEKPNLENLQKNIKQRKIEVINSNSIKKIVGSNKVESVELKTKYKGKSSLGVEMVFIYIGNNPNSSIAKSLGSKLNKKGEIIIDEKCSTNVSGLFAAGDVTNTDWKQAINASAQGARAAYEANNYPQSSRSKK